MADRADAAPPELNQLLNGGAARDRDTAWEKLVAHHSRLLMTVARSVASEHDGAMDAFTYVLERLREDDYKRLRGYVADGRSSFTTWLVVVARRICLDHYRQRYGRPPRGAPNGTARHERASRRRLFDLSPVLVDLAAIEDDALTPDAVLRVSQRDRALAFAIDALAPEDQVLLKLRFDDDLSAREIATILQMPSAFHVYRRLAAVYAQLRRRLLSRGVEGSAP